MTGPKEGGDGWGKVILTDEEVENLNTKLNEAIEFANTLGNTDSQLPEQSTPISE